ncbi:MAG: MBL fold metallo-hydrolase [bacterium]|nr:MBL fold metallo-hydrolase [bacterium]MDZ4284224.1 MBL fold metallo-hydrolase [Patescibacteria group bacterium]
MVITYYGHECFKVQFGDVVIAINPIAKSSRYKSARFGADIVLIGMNDADHNGASEVAFGGKEPFVVRGPGEYEIRDIAIKGFEAPRAPDGCSRTIYFLTLEGANLCILTGLHTASLPAPVLETLADVDVLFIPIAGGEVLSPADAYKLAVSLEPRIIIPMRHGEHKDAVKTFLKEGGVEKTQMESKLTVRRKDIADSAGQIVVLAPVGGE